jgi:hypothetical protein
MIGLVDQAAGFSTGGIHEAGTGSVRLGRRSVAVVELAD